jgi:hypothetical protein
MKWGFSWKISLPMVKISLYYRKLRCVCPEGIGHGVWGTAQKAVKFA